MSDEDGCARRALLSGAGAGLASAGAVVLAACGSTTNTAKQAAKKVGPTVKRTDLEILGRLLDLERKTVAAYTAGMPLLRHPQAKMAKQFLNQELQHTGELLSLIKTAGGDFPPRRASYDLGHPSDEPEVLSLLHELEREQIASYLRAIPRLRPGPVRAAVATILTNDAQHIAILRLTQGLPPIPSPFVSGKE